MSFNQLAQGIRRHTMDDGSEVEVRSNNGIKTVRITSPEKGKEEEKIKGAFAIHTRRTESLEVLPGVVLLRRLGDVWLKDVVDQFDVALVDWYGKIERGGKKAVLRWQGETSRYSDHPGAGYNDLYVMEGEETVARVPEGAVMGACLHGDEEGFLWIRVMVQTPGGEWAMYQRKHRSGLDTHLYDSAHPESWREMGRYAMPEDQLGTATDIGWNWRRSWFFNASGTEGQTIFHQAANAANVSGWGNEVAAGKPIRIKVTLSADTATFEEMEDETTLRWEASRVEYLWREGEDAEEKLGYRETLSYGAMGRHLVAVDYKGDEEVLLWFEGECEHSEVPGATAHDWRLSSDLREYQPPFTLFRYAQWKRVSGDWLDLKASVNGYDENGLVSGPVRYDPWRLVTTGAYEKTLLSGEEAQLDYTYEWNSEDAMFDLLLDESMPVEGDSILNRTLDLDFVTGSGDIFPQDYSPNFGRRYTILGLDLRTGWIAHRKAENRHTFNGSISPTLGDQPKFTASVAVNKAWNDYLSPNVLVNQEESEVEARELLMSRSKSAMQSDVLDYVTSENSSRFRTAGYFTDERFVTDVPLFALGHETDLPRWFRMAPNEDYLVAYHPVGKEAEPAQHLYIKGGDLQKMLGDATSIEEVSLF